MHLRTSKIEGASCLLYQLCRNHRSMSCKIENIFFIFWIISKLMIITILKFASFESNKKFFIHFSSTFTELGLSDPVSKRPHWVSKTHWVKNHTGSLRPSCSKKKKNSPWNRWVHFHHYSYKKQQENVHPKWSTIKKIKGKYGGEKMFMKKGRASRLGVKGVTCLVGRGRGGGGEGGRGRARLRREMLRERIQLISVSLDPCVSGTFFAEMLSCTTREAGGTFATK